MTDPRATSITLQVNGQPFTIEVPPDTPLLWALREWLGLTGTHYGCGMAQCGACTVHVNGVPTRSCVTPVSAVGAARITTIEGVAGPAADAVRDAWLRRTVPQCGYCQAGQIMSAVALLTTHPAPTDADIDRAMAGNLCRCGTYPRIRAAIHDAAQAMTSAAPQSDARPDAPAPAQVPPNHS